MYNLKEVVYFYERQKERKTDYSGEISLDL